MGKNCSICHDDQAGSKPPAHINAAYRSRCQVKASLGNSDDNFGFLVLTRLVQQMQRITYQSPRLSTRLFHRFNEHGFRQRGAIGNSPKLAFPIDTEVCWKNNRQLSFLLMIQYSGYLSTLIEGAFRNACETIGNYVTVTVQQNGWSIQVWDVWWEILSLLVHQQETVKGQVLIRI